MSTTEDVAAAYHEAGHVVAAWMTYQSVARCTIRGDHESDGRTTLALDEEYLADSSTWSLEMKVDAISRAMAGELSEVLAVADRRSQEGAGYLAGGADGMLRLMPNSDAALVFNIAGELADDAEREAFLRWIMLRTRAGLRLHWARVEAVAQALLREGLLDEVALEALHMANYPLTFEDDLSTDE